MAIPIIPIILGLTSIASSITQGISSAGNSKKEAEAINKQAEEKINERAREAKKIMQQQKTSFLKGGIYFDSGSPTDVINETYDTSMKDINSIKKDSGTKINNLMRQGRTAFLGSILNGSLNAAMNFNSAGGSDFKNFWASTTTSSTNI